MKNALVILAGGKGTRFGQKTPKQFYRIGDTTILNTFLSNLDVTKFNIIVIAISSKYRQKIQNDFLNKFSKQKIIFADAGKTRQESSFNSLRKLSNYKIENVLIHDAARPFCSNKLIKKILSKLKNKNNCIPYVEYSDRQINKKNFQNEKIINIQTPQGFNYKLIYNAHKKLIKYNLSDDSELIQILGTKIYFTKGDKENIKITYPEDLIFINKFIKPNIRSGIGYDIHQIDKKSKKGLKLCGIKLPFAKLIGHSDADVGLHAICDSIFGALSMRDIGYYFPNSEKKWKNAKSSIFVEFCRKALLNKGYHIVNLDINIIAEKPKINKFVMSMKGKIAQLLKINIDQISIKATTNEKIGFIGDGEGIAAEAIVQISNENHN